ncbi:SDR family oxidoreductase [Actinoplanes solisilvae]|uniref:SDR family oxidoreductase n=1 Tax=Actinoplanes solisilvae TaxID=2486853 RepID=UPI000FD70F8F|nr:SDR family oxidoreductase [Actinoplanes solisilvae]
MKIAVLGGTGLIGSQVVTLMREHGHDAEPLSPSNGVDLLSGEGLDNGLKGADVVVNLTNSPTFDEKSPGFFHKTMDNMLDAAERQGVGHAVILSIIGVDQVPDLEYYKAKVLQEELLKAGPVPWSIVRAGQFFEFVPSVIKMGLDGDVAHIPATPVQPLASADISRAVAQVAAGKPLLAVKNVAGPEVFALDELCRIAAQAKGVSTQIVTDPSAGMFGAVQGSVLTAPDDATLTTTTYREWLAQQK